RCPDHPSLQCRCDQGKPEHDDDRQRSPLHPLQSAAVLLSLRCPGGCIRMRTDTQQGSGVQHGTPGGRRGRSACREPSMKPTVLALIILVVGNLTACAQSRPVAPTLPGPTPVGQVALVTAILEPAPVQQLDIGVQVFDNRSSNQFAADGAVSVFTRIREIESQYLPLLLRNTLIESGQWGVVRVLPEADPSMDLLVSGTILASDGTELLLEIKVSDSSGREWISQHYLDQASTDDYP